MDIQQDYQNQQGQYHQRYDTKNRFKDISSLDALTEYAIGALTEKASCILNHEHFKAGFQFGALLIMQLLF